MMRQLVTAAMITGCFAVHAFAAADDKPNPPQNQAVERPAQPSNDLARTSMHRLLDLKLDETPLTSAFDRMRDLMPGAPLFVNWKALDAAGVRRDLPVSLNLRNVHASTALDLLLRVAAPEGPRLGWRIDQGVINVSTVEDLKKNVVIQVYDVRDLLPRNAPPAERQRRVNALIKFLSDRIDPASWKTRGGNLGAMRELQGQLIVTQTPKNHRAMVDLLQGLRQLKIAE